MGDLCRKVGIFEQSFSRWKKVHGGLQPSEARELKQRREKSAKLKRLVAYLALDTVMLEDIVSAIKMVVERAMYSDAGGVRWAAGTNALATKLPEP